MNRFVLIFLALLSLESCAPTQRLAKTSTPSGPFCGCEGPPAPAYLVYFDWNKVSLRPSYKARIAEAAAESRSSHSNSIYVWGYTDSSGSATYNQLLSIRRAKTVADELVADGVPRSELRIRGYGAGHQLQPTGPNVRSPSNRLVEIVLQ